jgi:hypothetical protein
MRGDALRGGIEHLPEYASDTADVGGHRPRIPTHGIGDAEQLIS